MDKDYVPYGPEWEKELMKLTKAQLIDLYRRQVLYSNKLTTSQPDSPPVAGEMDKFDVFERVVSMSIEKYNNPNATLAIVATAKTMFGAASHHGSVDAVGIDEIKDAARDYATDWEPQLEKVSMESFTKGVDWVLTRYAPANKREPQEETQTDLWLIVKSVFVEADRKPWPEPVEALKWVREHYILTPKTPR